MSLAWPTCNCERTDYMRNFRIVALAVTALLALAACGDSGGDVATPVGVDTATPVVVTAEPQAATLAPDGE